jgi:protein TonB
MTKREVWALAGSIIVHLGVVFMVGASLNSPAKIVNRIEIDLEGARETGKAPGMQAPTPSPAPVRPEATAQPSRSTVPQRTARPRITQPQAVVSPPQPPVESDGSLAVHDVPDLAEQPAVALTLPGGSGAPAESANGSDAPAESAKGGGGEGERGQGLASAGYFAAVRMRVDEAKQYPHIAQQRRIQGRVLVAFSLTPGGQLSGEPQLVQSSGFGVLDRAALKAVRRGAPYPEFPGKVEELPEIMRVEVAFIMR